MSNVQALFVESRGVYPELLGADRCWDVKRDARTYVGPSPVVAHPPCARWSRLAESVAARFPGRPEMQVGADDGCFASALDSVRTHGGVLEHPASSKAWAAHGLNPPNDPSYSGWAPCGIYGHKTADGWGYSWVCEVWQSAYGHPAPKRTWLLYCGKRPPFELDWRRLPGTHAVGGDSKKRRAQGANARPRLTGKQNLATPRAFAETLIRLAAWSQHVE